MRAIALVLLLGAYSPAVLVLPHLGVLLWCWIAFMNPQQMSWGNDLRLNVGIAALTLLGWLVSREPKRIAMGATLIWLVAFIAWMTVTTWYSLVPELSQPAWEANMKTMILVIAVMGLMRTRTRLHALIWIMALSIGYFGVKGGAFVLATAGAHTVMGPENTALRDNNAMALALMMVIPLLNYLRLHSRRVWVRGALLGAIALTIVALLGTYSRGGLTGLAILSAFFCYRSRHPVRVALIGLAILVPAVLFMPQQWEDRMLSIGTYEQDASAQSRFDSWSFSVRLALDHPVLGGGLDAIRDQDLWHQYNPDKHPFVAHSIYFQVLADMGFAGLALYLALAAATWRNMSRVVKNTRRKPELEWAHDLAQMIQVSLVGFLVTAALGPWAYIDFYFALIGTAASLRRLVDVEVRAPRAVASSPAGRLVAARQVASPALAPAHPGGAG